MGVNSVACPCSGGIGMGDYLFKLRFLFLPMVACAVVVILGYLACTAFLFEGTDLFAVDGEVQEFWLPFAVSGIAAMVFLGPRMRIFAETEKRHPGGLTIFAGMLMIFPSCGLLQFSLQEALWGLRSVDTVNAIPYASKARFYVTKGDCVEVQGTRWNGFVHRVGRSSDIAFELYAAVPICSLEGAATHWIGLHRSHRVSSSMPEAERLAEANRFEEKMRADILSREALNFTYYERVRAGADLHHYQKAIGTSDAGIVLVTPHLDNFGERTFERVTWALMAFGASVVLFAIVLAFWWLNPDEVESVRKTGKLTPKPKGEPSLWSLVIPSRDFYGPAVLIDIIVGVFVAMVLAGLGVTSFAADDLLAWGANHGPLGFGPGNYGLVTAMFLHGGLMHMFNNLYGLLFAVMCLAPVARNSRLILCFLLCGIAGSVASVLWNPHVIGVGASGAVLGLWGIAVALAVLRDHRIAGNESFILKNVAIYGAITVAMGLLLPNIDNAAHIGGFAVGLVIGVVLYVWEKIAPDPEYADAYQGLVKNLQFLTGKQAP